MKMKLETKLKEGIRDFGILPDDPLFTKTYFGKERLSKIKAVLIEMGLVGAPRQKKKSRTKIDPLRLN